MIQTYGTALIALSPSLQNQNLLQLLSRLKLQVVNKSQATSRESIILDLENIKPDFLFISSVLSGSIELTDLINHVKQLSPQTKIVLTVNESDARKILSYVNHNVDGILWSENFFEVLEFAVKQILKGQAFICGSSLQELKTSLKEQRFDETPALGLLKLLTGREKEVLNSLSLGMNYKQISKLLFISESTVKTHTNNIFTKLNVSDRTQAVLYALNHGIRSLIKKPDILKNLTNESREELEDKIEDSTEDKAQEAEVKS